MVVTRTSEGCLKSVVPNYIKRNIHQRSPAKPTAKIKDMKNVAKKTKLLDLKKELLKDHDRIQNIFDDLDEKNALILLKKINAFISKPNKGKNGQQTTTTKLETTTGMITPTPSAKPIGPMDFDQEEFDNYKPGPAPGSTSSEISESNTEPFPSSEHESIMEESDSNAEVVDDLNEAINLGEEDLMDDTIVRSIRVRDRFGDKDDFINDKSIVTRQNLHIPKTVDPFKDGNKVLGKFPFQRNPYSNAPLLTESSQITKLPENLTKQLNEDDYDAKAKWRAGELMKMGLYKDKLELKNATSEVLNERERLKNEYKRYVIDRKRREEKEPEPNMIDTTTGECSQVWRDWFQRRMMAC